MQQFFSLILLLIVNPVFSQTTIEWSPEYQIQLDDFQSPETEINEELTSYSIISGASIDFNFQMSNGEFMFTKNFNSAVTTLFNKKVAAIIAPDSLLAQQLVKFGQYTFDLSELYSRRFRKEIYEQKGAFSNANFFRPIHAKLQEEMSAEIGRVLKATDVGRNEELLKMEHQKVLALIEALPDYCKECKPVKKKKSKKTN